MGTKISSLPVLSTVTDATIISVVEGGANKKITGAVLKAYATGAQGPTGPQGPSGATGPQGASATVPKITSIVVTDSSYTTLDDTAVGIGGGYIKIIGTGFTAGSQVLIGNVSATSVSFVSVTELRAQLPATAAGTYVVYVVATDGSVAIRVNGITFSATPTWSTGSTLTAGSSNVPISIQLAATSDTAVTYAVASGSSLPTGLSLSSGGVLSGTITGISVDTTYNFTVTAIDAENQDSPRAFSITITVVLQVARSLRFNSANTAYLSRTPASAGNLKTFTFSTWVKRSEYGNQYAGTPYAFIYSAGTSGASETSIVFTNSKLEVSNTTSGTLDAQLRTTSVYRDFSAWYHIVVAWDTTQSTAANRIKIYVNGVEQTAFDISTYPAQNTNSAAMNTTLVNKLGIYNTNSFPVAAYMTEVNFVDGQQITPTSFGEADPDTGVWRPKRYTGTYGTNGFYLNFADNSNTTAATLGKDSSGNGNNFTPTNFSVAAGVGNDSVVDSPTSYGTDTGVGGEVRGNYATWNPLNANTTYITLSNGNLTYEDTTVGGSFQSAVTTMFANSGKWYAEFTMGTYTSGMNAIVGIASPPPSVNFYIEQSVTGYAGYGYYASGSKVSAAGGVGFGASYTTGDVISIAVDIDNLKVWFAKNGVWQDGGNPLTGTAPAYNIQSGLAYGFACGNGGSTNSSIIYANFGQRAFAYTAPSGFKTLCSQNLPTPTIGATSSTQASKYFNSVLYTGNGNNTQSITVGFRPDFIWTKSRSNAYYHVLFDAVRGRGMLVTNNTNAEVTSPGTVYELTSYDNNGFTLGPDYSLSVNPNGSSMVAWNWNAGGDTVTNTAGSISAQVRANPTAGFSIATYTGVSNGTVGHGLGVAPSMIIVKSRGAQNWFIYHTSLGNTQYMTFSGDAATTNSGAWNNTSPTSSVFTTGSFFSTNSMVAYCFAEVPGYSKFGSYTGNASTDGPFVYCGFRPRWIMIKRTDYDGNGPQWNIFDAVRPNSYNDSALGNLRANATDAESAGWPIDFVSNGFKIRYAGETNYAGLHIFAAFAETPFKYARAR